jgi:ATP-dependent Clp protease protease subunit
MIHQPSSGTQGTSSDMQIALSEVLKVKKELYEILATHSGQPFEKIQIDSDRDFWMTSNEAKQYGLIDFILERNK